MLGQPKIKRENITNTNQKKRELTEDRHIEKIYTTRMQQNTYIQMTSHSQ